MCRLFSFRYRNNTHTHKHTRAPTPSPALTVGPRDGVQDVRLRALPAGGERVRLHVHGVARERLQVDDDQVPPAGERRPVARPHLRRGPPAGEARTVGLAETGAV